MSNLLEKASLVMIPSGYKEDVVYSQIPLDGSGDMNLTRASDGTRVNSAGLVEVVPWNLLGYSEDFSNAYWTKVSSPVMAYNVATAPNGTMTAASIQSNSAVNFQSITATTLSVAPNSTVTLSIYIKKETTKTYFGGSYLQFTGGTTKITYVLFDEVNGTINIVAPDQISMVTSVESVGNWWRFIVTGTDTGSNTNLNFGFYGTLSQNGTTIGAGIGSARTIWGFQFNIGSTAKPYFPTTDRLNVPRLTYQNGGGGCPSLLLEKQSTNLFSYSEELDNAYWAKITSVSVTANNSISPDGTQNADLITTTANSQRIQRAFSGLTAGTRTLSCYVKAGSGTEFTINTYDGIVDKGAGFNLTTGAVTFTSAGVTATINNCGNGWYRVTHNYTSAGTGYSCQFYFDNTGTYSLWGMQFEESSYVTSYIPTQASSATRVADACSKTGISSLIGQTEGVLFVDINRTQKSENYNVPIFIGSGANLVQLYFTSANVLVGQVYTSAGQQVGIVSSALANGRYKVALGYKTNDFAMYINGVQIGTDSSGTVPTCSQLFIGNDDTGALNFNDSINQAALFPTRLTNAELASLTTI